ncbi:Crp/Fnr family transcriptional regulator [Halomonas sp. LR3S48]|uniref:Crp/Fnr family transcriptional regulator n=1 Tax=Halomonadaceae TaxID=28256 RepID=UPI0021E3F1B8|nr:Crp/Fnr family transcriptional regulator [Halomonas sp. LR3S48]UYG05524.1 Crp/Fnr family transcriptional regulator [Halomonas sp. LR3S48]
MSKIISSDPPSIVSTIEALAGRSGRRRQLAAGEMLFHAGEVVTSVYVMVYGQVRLIRVSHAGAEVTVNRAGPACWLAEASLFAERYHCDAIADSEACLLSFPKAVVMEGMQRRPELATSLMADLARRLHEARLRIAILNIPTARERLLAYLRAYAGGEGAELKLPGSWKALASEIGLTHESVYRALAQLQREGRIRREGRQVWLMPPSG